jgi:uncharacterized membrane protein
MSEPAQEEQPSKLTINSMLSLPVVKFVGIAVTLLYAGWMANSHVSRIERSIEQLSTKVDAATADRYTRTDHIIWSSNLRSENAGKITVPQVSDRR